MVHLSLDFETRSPVDLKKRGVYVYAESPETEVLCMAYAFEGEEPQIWVPGQEEFPVDVIEQIEQGGPLRAWNVQFERIVWRDILVPQFGAPLPELEQWYCTAAEARAMALPRSLGACARALNMDVLKDDPGYRLMLKMCAPQKDGTYFETPDALERLYEYCKTDVAAEQSVATRLRRLSDHERRVFLMDQRANDRGIRVDLELVDAAKDVAALATDAVNADLSEITGGVVTKVTQVQRLLHWVQERGLEVDSLQKHILRDTLAREDLEDDVRAALEARREAGKASIAKLRAMRAVSSTDGYARGLLLYHGASTGRWAGMKIQPQNFPRGEVKNPEKYIEDVFFARELGFWPHAEPSPLATISALLRGCFISSPGCSFMSGDYSQIEARVLGWLANEPYQDLEYERMAAAIFDVSLQTICDEHARGESERRKMGKDTVLGCGYQMGKDRFIEQAWERSGAVVSEDLADKAVSTYRAIKPGIPALWYGTEDAAKEAAGSPGKVAYTGTGGCVRYVVRNQFLWCILPSGRALTYALPLVKMRETKFGMREQLTYMGVDPYTKKWKRRATYGGHLVENIVQAMARDIMAGAMLRLDDGGYRPVLSVHDEVICDVPGGHGSLEEFQALLEAPVAWASGLSIETECWQGLRYKKE